MDENKIIDGSPMENRRTFNDELKNDIPAIPERPKSKLDFDPKKDVYIVKRIKKFRFKKMALEYLERF